jgi:arylsulfatase A-like enzyme
MDRLAREGVRYETVYSAAPMCALSRFALLTGKYAESCGPAHHMRRYLRFVLTGTYTPASPIFGGS